VTVKNLGNRDIAGCVADQDNVGKRAADIDPDAISGSVSHPLLFHVIGQKEIAAPDCSCEEYVKVR